MITDKEFEQFRPLSRTLEESLQNLIKMENGDNLGLLHFDSISPIHYELSTLGYVEVPRSYHISKGAEISITEKGRKYLEIKDGYSDYLARLAEVKKANQRLEEHRLADARRHEIELARIASGSKPDGKWASVGGNVVASLITLVGVLVINVGQLRAFAAARVFGTFVVIIVAVAIGSLAYLRAFQRLLDRDSARS